MRSPVLALDSVSKLSDWGVRAGLAMLVALGLAAAPARAAEPMTRTYAFTADSDLKYTVHHLFHTTEGKAHGISGRVAIKGDEILLPFVIEVPLAGFKTDDDRRDHEALTALGADAQPAAKLVVQRIALAWKTFKAGQVGGRLDFQGTAHGDLTLRGQTRPIAIPVTGWALPFDAQVSARFAVSLAAHGVPAPWYFLIPVDDRVEIEVEAVARRTGH